ncbi:MAG: hypothetical protein R6V48_05875 [Fidelibacterota bacterium]
MKKTGFKQVLFITLMLLAVATLQGATRYKWVVIGSLQNFFYDTGSEREHAVYAQQQWGFCWDAFYRDQDMQAAKGIWIGAADFYDPVMDREYAHKVAHNGPRAVTDVEIREYIPQEIKLVARRNHPEVFVDENEGSDMMNGADGKNDDIDEIDPAIPTDRMVVNRVNTSLGLTMTRKVYVVSQQNYDNIHISEYEFENTGIYNQDGDVHQQTLEGVYFHWQWRDAISQEGCWNGTYTAAHRNWISTSVRDVRWGFSMMNDVIGEDQDNPTTSSLYPDMTGLDAQANDGSWMRGYCSWMGKWSDFGYDNIGSPNVNSVVHNDFPPIDDGRLGAAQYKGMVTIHADKSTTDPSDDLSQPRSNAYINSNHSFTNTAGMDQYDADGMTAKYQQYIANGDMGSHAEKVWKAKNGDAGAYSKDNGAAGYSQMLAYGPYTIAPGERIKIVWAEAADGLGHDYGYHIGQQWYKARYDNETVEVVDPDNPSSTMTINKENADEWKNAMVYSGRDSLMNTFRRAIDLYNAGFYNGIPEAPPPPDKIEIFSTEDGVKIIWDGESAISSPNFEGFKIYRAFMEKDSNYHEVVDCNISTDNNLDGYRIDDTNEFEFIDIEPMRGQNYYYYIISYDDGTQNELKPGVPLESSPFYTRTNRPATVKSPPAPNEQLDIDDFDLTDPVQRKELMDFLIKIVPNPINVRNEPIQFRGNVNKLLFAGVPSGCRIKIYSERGDFVADVEESEEGFAWYLTTDWQQILVSGIYIAHFEMMDDFENPKTGVELRQGDSTIKKFIIIR